MVWAVVGSGMFVVANRIPVADGYEEQFEDRFSERVAKVDERPGFVRMEVLRPTGDEPYVVLTYWESEADFEAWTDSEDFREAHANRPPPEMFDGENAMEAHEVALSSE